MHNKNNLSHGTAVYHKEITTKYVHKHLQIKKEISFNFLIHAQSQKTTLYWIRISTKLTYKLMSRAKGTSGDCLIKNPISECLKYVFLEPCNSAKSKQILTGLRKGTFAIQRLYSYQICTTSQWSCRTIPKSQQMFIMENVNIFILENDFSTQTFFQNYPVNWEISAQNVNVWQICKPLKKTQ